MMRAVCCTLYQAFGRAVEVASLEFGSMVWNSSLGCVEADWRELKTGKSAMMSFFADYKSYKVCWYHAMFCYILSRGQGFEIMVNDPLTEGSKFVFPAFVSISLVGVSSKITNIMKEWVGKVPGLTAKHTSQGFKHGAVDDASFHDCCSIIAIVARANWDYTGQVSFATAVSFTAPCAIYSNLTFSF